MSECKCSMRTSLVGDGCSVCNPEYWTEVLVLSAFDDWFDESGYDEHHRDALESAWKEGVVWGLTNKGQ